MLAVLIFPLFVPFVSLLNPQSLRHSSREYLALCFVDIRRAYITSTYGCRTVGGAVREAAGV